jgi:Fe-S-cluster containining protein
MKKITIEIPLASDENMDITSMMPGSVYPFRPTGRCVFFKEGRCSIHEAKPRECRFADHTKTMEECSEDRGKMVDEWKKEEHQQYIADILGYKPVKPEAGIFDIFGLLF